MYKLTIATLYLPTIEVFYYHLKTESIYVSVDCYNPYYNLTCINTQSIYAV